MIRLNIVQKFVAYLVITGIVPLVAVGLVSYGISSRVVHREARDYTRTLVQNQSDYLELQFTQIESLLANVSGVEEIRSAIESSLDGESSTFNDLTTREQIGKILNNYSSLEGLVSIDIFTTSGTHYRVGDTLDTQNTRQDVVEQLNNATLNSDALVLWYGITNNVNINSSYLQVVTLSKILYRIDDTTFERLPSALLLVNYSAEYLYDHFSSVALDKDAYLLVVDANGGIIYHPDEQRVGTQADPGLINQLRDQHGTVTTDVAGQNVSISYVRLEPSGWLVASLIPTATLNSKTASIRTTTLIVIGIFLVIVGLTAYVYSRTVVTPIRQIIHRLQELQAGKAPAALQMPDAGHDEIGELSRWFNRFLESLIARQAAEAERERLIEELRQATELAQESSRLKSEFLATVSHELRTPLNAIDGFTSIMLAGMGVELEPLARDMVGRISSNSKRLLNLINDFLDITRIESGRMSMAPVPLVLTELVEKWHKQVSVLADNKGLEIETTLDPALPRSIVADEDALTKIAVNLLSNAVKFTHHGKVRLILRPQDDTHWVLEVSDSGIGIPPYALAYIFDEFRQVDQSSKRMYGGTGLGLAIVRKLVANLGGTVKVNSEVGVGSTFTVSLPLHNSQEA